MCMFVWDKYNFFFASFEGHKYHDNQLQYNNKNNDNMEKKFNTPPKKTKLLSMYVVKRMKRT